MSRKLARTNPALAPASPIVPRDSGLNRLFGTSVDFPELVELDLDQVRPNPEQPRRHFDPADLMELADSIRHNGLLQPILVKKHGEGGYIIAAGERRWRAHGLLGKPTIFAVVTKGDIEEVALVENLQRRDLDALETASALARLGERHHYAQEQLAAIVGLSKSEVSRLLALRGLPEKVQAEYPTFRDQVTKKPSVCSGRYGRGGGPPCTLGADQGWGHHQGTACRQTTPRRPKAGCRKPGPGGGPQAGAQPGQAVGPGRSVGGGRGGVADGTAQPDRPADSGVKYCDVASRAPKR